MEELSYCKSMPWYRRDWSESKNTMFRDMARYPRKQGEGYAPRQSGWVQKASLDSAAGKSSVQRKTWRGVSNVLLILQQDKCELLGRCKEGGMKEDEERHQQ